MYKIDKNSVNRKKKCIIDEDIKWNFSIISAFYLYFIEIQNVLYYHK